MLADANIFRFASLFITGDLEMVSIFLVNPGHIFSSVNVASAPVTTLLITLFFTFLLPHSGHGFFIGLFILSTLESISKECSHDSQWYSYIGI